MNAGDGQIVFIIFHQHKIPPPSPEKMLEEILKVHYSNTSSGFISGETLHLFNTGWYLHDQKQRFCWKTKILTWWCMPQFSSGLKN